MTTTMILFLKRKASFLTRTDCNAVQISPLTMAVLSGQLEMVRTLIRRGADVNAPSSGQATALHATCLVVIDVNRPSFGPSFYHMTALQAACLLGNLDLVRYLVAHGADLHHSDCNGMDAMKLAAVRGKAKTLEYLIQV